jgi:hypothetical protein
MPRSFRIFRRIPFWTTLVLVAALIPLPASAGSGPSVKVLHSGLNNPRGLDRQPGGAILVAEAGKGGSGPCQPGPEGGDVCVGLTGSLTRLTRDGRERLIRLPSHAAPDGSGALGPHDVAKDGGTLFATVGLGGDEALREGFGPKGRRLGTFVRVTRGGGVRVVADLLEYEATHDPAGDGVDSNPYGLLRLADSSVVTDAGGNSLLRVSDRGRVSTIAVFPNRNVPFDGGTFSMDAVPTTVVRGPDGAFYVGQLTGFPFPVHGARIFRVVPGQRPTVWARGFTNIIDIAFDPDGNLYVLEITHNGLLSPSPMGALMRLNTDGSRERLLDAFFPTSLELARGGRRVFMTVCGVCAGGGEVWRVDL